MTLAYVGLGSNLERPADQVRQAIEDISRLRSTKVLTRSSLYRSAPVGYATQPDFVNAVAAIETDLSADALLAELQRIEAEHGRARSFANAPRTLDLDLLLYGEAVLREAGLTIPHPRMHERAFVLQPLLEIAPDVAIPGVGLAREQLARCRDQRVERVT